MVEVRIAVQHFFLDFFFSLEVDIEKESPYALIYPTTVCTSQGWAAAESGNQECDPGLLCGWNSSI